LAVPLAADFFDTDEDVFRCELAAVFVFVPGFAACGVAEEFCDCAVKSGPHIKQSAQLAAMSAVFDRVGRDIGKQIIPHKCSQKKTRLEPALP
jgi:hypothetical protein